MVSGRSIISFRFGMIILGNESCELCMEIDHKLTNKFWMKQFLYLKIRYKNGVGAELRGYVCAIHVYVQKCTSKLCNIHLFFCSVHTIEDSVPWTAQPCTLFTPSCYSSPSPLSDCQKISQSNVAYAGSRPF